MMDFEFSDKNLERVSSKLAGGERLSLEDGLALYDSPDLMGIGRLANRVRTNMHGKKGFFIYNQHINYTNVCLNRCRFCAFSKKDSTCEGAYTYSIDDIRKRVLDRIDEPVREFHIVGGINESLPFDYYLEMISAVKEIRPDAAVKAFTAVEIDYFSRISGMSVTRTIDELKKAGLDMMPGGGAEVLSDRIHDRLFPEKIGRKRWLQVMREVHGTGITANATMLYGHMETPEEKVRHMMQLRELQDETGGFTAFIPLAFHSANTELAHLDRTTSFEDLKNLAVSRLMLDNFDHIKSYWVMLGEKLAQIGLSFGADDLDGTIIEEKITHTAGAESAVGLSRREMVRMVTNAGFVPVERDSFYNAV